MVRKESYSERFNPDGECLAVALDFVSFSLKSIFFDKKEVLKIRGLFSIIEFLKKHDFNCIVKVPYLRIIIPSTWYLFLFYNKYISFGRAFQLKKKGLKKNGSRFLTLYHMTANQLYNLKGESWTHYIIGNSMNTQLDIYDPLFNTIQREYDIVCPINYDEVKLDNAFNIKFLIWIK